MKKKKKIATYNLTWEQIENIKLKATSEAMDFAFRQMMLLPLMVLRDHYGFGAKRLEEETGINVINGDFKKK